MTGVGRWWFARGTAKQVAALRLFVGAFALVYLIVRWGELLAVARLPKAHWRPVGVTRLLDGPLPEAVVIAISAVTIVLVAAFVVGVGYRMIAPLAAIAFLWTTTYRNSWGMVFHTENLAALHLLALAVAPAAHAWSIDAWRAGRRGTALRDPVVGFGWSVKLCGALTVATYVLAGVAKLRIAGLDWLDGEHLRNQIAIDNLRKALLGDHVAILGNLFLEHPNALTMFCVLTLVLELGAPIALVGDRLGTLWSLGAWGFHLGVVLLMNIWFLYPLLGLAFLPFVRSERLVEWLIARRHRFRRKPA